MKCMVAAIFSVVLGISLTMWACATGSTSASSVDGYGWTNGNLILTTIHSISQCHDAAISAFADLGIKVVSDETDTLSGNIHGRGPEGESVTVRLIPQGLDITRIELRVGSRGNRGDSELLADNIQRHLR